LYRDAGTGVAALQTRPCCCRKSGKTEGGKHPFLVTLKGSRTGELPVGWVAALQEIAAARRRFVGRETPWGCEGGRQRVKGGLPTGSEKRMRGTGINSGRGGLAKEGKKVRLRCDPRGGRHGWFFPGGVVLPENAEAARGEEGRGRLFLVEEEDAQCGNEHCFLVAVKRQSSS